MHVVAFVVQVGRAVTEPVSPERVEFHKWLSTQITGEPPNSYSLARRGTTYLTFEDLERSPASIREHLSVSRVPRAAHVILDLSGAPYDLLREPLLMQIGDIARTYARDARRLVTLLLPEHPPRDSPFWSSVVSDVTAGALFVIASDGKCQLFGQASWRWSAPLRRAYALRQDTLNAPEPRRDRFVRHLGHFDATAFGGPLECARYFFDPRAHLSQYADELSANIASRYSKAERQGATLVIAAPRSEWAHRLGLLCGFELALPVVPLDLEDPRRLALKNPARAKAQLSDVRNIVICDVVNSGRTVTAMLARLRLFGKPVPDHVFAVFAAREEIHRGRWKFKVKAIESVDLARLPRAACPQCKVGVPHPERVFTEDGLFDSAVLVGGALGTYDFWDMALRGAWVEETYGPEGAKFFEAIPDTRSMFREHGDWLATRYETILQEMGATRDVALVCPAEDGVRELMKKLTARFDDRPLTVVQIPRRILNDVRKHGPQGLGDPERRGSAAWRRQLRHLSRGKAFVVMLDEFNASNHTRDDMMQVMRHFSVAVNAYMPFLNRVIATPNEAPKTRPLYEIHSPRL